MELKKSTAEVYKIKVNDTWANITIESLGQKGYISIQSDFGEWNNSWWSCGCEFKEFLTGLNMGYTAGKMTPREDNHLFEEDTLNVFKNDFKDAFEQQSIDEDTYNSLMDEVANLEEEGHIVENLKGCGFILDFYNYMPEFNTGVSPTFERFWNKIWVPFTKVLKTEINDNNNKQQ